MGRAHCIGLTKRVYVFWFITENSVQEHILDRAAKMLRLDELVNQRGWQQQSKGPGDRLC